MTDAHITLQAQNIFSPEYVTHQAITFFKVDLASVVSSHASRVLTSVLKNNKAVIQILYNR
jgi:hypothetical protein